MDNGLQVKLFEFELSNLISLATCDPLSWIVEEEIEIR